MAKEFAKKFYDSSKWKKCRSAYIEHRRAIDGGMCETCHEEIGYIVHHKEELTPDNIDDPDITLGFWNLKYDCHACHQKENKKDGPADNLVKYEFTDDGELRVLPPLNSANSKTDINHSPTYKEYRGRAREGV